MGFSKTESLSKTSVIGMLGGVTAAIVGHPFDTIKTRMQSVRVFHHFILLSERPKMITYVQSVKVKFNPRSLYRGLIPPLLSVPPSWVVNFVSFGAALKLIGDATTSQHFFAGSVSGIFWALMVTPFELVKCRAQCSNTTSSIEFRRILEKNRKDPIRILKSLYRGTTLTAIRDFFGIGVWFSIYHITSTKMELSPFLSGGLSGLSCWLTILPVDYVKTNYQIDNKASLIGSIRAAAVSIRGIWAVISVIAVQQFIRTGCSMIVVEKARSYF